MDTKSLGFNQVCYTQELSRYNFWIGYQEGTANRTNDILSRYPNQNIKKVISPS